VFAEHEAVRPPQDLRSLAELQVIEARFRLARGEVAVAEMLALAAERTAAEQGWDDVVCDATCALSTVFRGRGMRTRAAEMADRARIGFERLGDAIGVARAQALLADNASDVDRAAALAEAALASIESRGIREGSLYAAILLRVGNGRRLCGDRDGAQAWYERARTEYERLGDRASLGQILAALASIPRSSCWSARSSPRRSRWSSRWLPRWPSCRAISSLQSSSLGQRPTACTTPVSARAFGPRC
jgi:hypothetical protein